MNSPIATLQMADGHKIIAELYPQEAPNTVNSFIYLAQLGCFDNHAIERIVPGYVVDVSYTAFGLEKCKYMIANESRSHGIANNVPVKPGYIAMGGYEEGIAGGEFFFPLAYHAELDGAYPAFGRILEGLEEILRWETVELIPVPYPANPDVEINEPIIPIVIQSVRVETFGVKYPEPVRVSFEKRPPNW